MKPSVDAVEPLLETLAEELRPRRLFHNDDIVPVRIFMPRVKLPPRTKHRLELRVEAPFRCTSFSVMGECHRDDKLWSLDVCPTDGPVVPQLVVEGPLELGVFSIFGFEAEILCDTLPKGSMVATIESGEKELSCSAIWTGSLHRSGVDPLLRYAEEEKAYVFVRSLGGKLSPLEGTRDRRR
jgi:hypothetical protein